MSRRAPAYAKWFCLDCATHWSPETTTPCPRCCGYKPSGSDAAVAGSSAASTSTAEYMPSEPEANPNESSNR